MLRNQENIINENKEYMKEVQQREEQSFKEMVEPLENELFNKACQMEEKANLIEQYLGQIVKMQDEIKQLQKETKILTEEIESRRINTEKISLAKQAVEQVKEKVVSFASFIKKRILPNHEFETNEVEEAISDVEQSNLKDDKKSRVCCMLEKLIKLLNE